MHEIELGNLRFETRLDEGPDARYAAASAAVLAIVEDDGTVSFLANPDFVQDWDGFNEVCSWALEAQEPFLFLGEEDRAILAAKADALALGGSQ